MADDDEPGELDEPRVVRPCAYWRCDELAKTYKRAGRPRKYCSVEHRRAAERDPAPFGAQPAAAAQGFAHPLSHPAVKRALDVLTTRAVLQRIGELPPTDPLGVAATQVIDLLSKGDAKP